jgi:superkiller protein 3
MNVKLTDVFSLLYEDMKFFCINLFLMYFKIHVIGLAMFLAGGRFRSDKNASMKYLLDSVRGDPLTGEGFTFLGHYYGEVISGVQVDREKAIKCYTKALGIDPLDEEAGWGISELYMNENNLEKALKLWVDITTLTGHAHWCYPLLGQCYMCHGEYEESVKSFQKALELQPVNASCWHGLVSMHAYIYT